MSCTFSLSGSLSVCVCVWVWLRVGQASGGLNHTVWALRWMDRAWLRAERVLYASTHSPGSVNSPRSSSLTMGWWKETCQYIQDFSYCWREEQGARGESRRRGRVDESEKCLRMHLCVCMCAKRQEVRTLYSRQWVQGNNESLCRQVGENKERQVKLKRLHAHS